MNAREEEFIKKDICANSIRILDRCLDSREYILLQLIAEYKKYACECRLSLFPVDNLTAGSSFWDVGSFEVKEFLPVACEEARKPERS